MTAGLNLPTDQLERKADLKGLIFIGKVVNNIDPSHLERVRVYVPELMHNQGTEEQYPWAIPVHSRCQGMLSNVGTFGVPAVGSEVYVEFQHGDPSYPVYWGSVVSARAKVDLADTNYPARYGIQDTHGNYLYIDTAAGDAEIFHHTGLKIRVEADGTVNILTPNNVNVNVNGNTQLQVTGNVIMNASGNLQATTGGDMIFSASGKFQVQASGIALDSSGNCVSNSSGTFQILASDIRLN